MHLFRLIVCLLLLGAPLSGTYAANQPAPATYANDAHGDDIYSNCSVDYGQVGTAAEGPHFACELADFTASATKNNGTVRGSSPVWEILYDGAFSIDEVQGPLTVCSYNSAGVNQGCLGGTLDFVCPSGGLNEKTPGGLDYPGFCMELANTNHNTGCPNCNAKAGDPIDTASGNEYESVTDYRGGGAFPLVFSRAYNSELTGQTGENMGNAWSTNLGTHLSIVTRGQLVVCPEPNSPFNYYGCPVVGYVSGAQPIEVTIWGADGSQSLFTYQQSSAPDGTQLVTEQTTSGQLFFAGALPAPASGSGFRYLRTDGYTEYFTSTGQLVAVQNPAGLQQIYQYYSDGQLESVTDSFGRPLKFTYYSNGLIQTVTTPTGSPAGTITYGYDTNNNLTSVQYPDGSTVQYKYEDSNLPNALTGIVDEDGNRYATWSYDDSSGRATTSQRAGGVDSLSIVYSTGASTSQPGQAPTAPANTVLSAQITEPTGLARTLTFNTINFKTLLQSASAPCTECGDKTQSLTYDANGYVASRTDFDGNVTTYLNDAFGNEISRTEGQAMQGGNIVPTQWTRTIGTQWNYSINQPSLITEPGRTTAYTYYGSGALHTKTVTDTATEIARTTTYTYYTSGVANGLLGTVTDPMGNVTTYGYDSQGNLQTITNALQETTTISNYDLNGMPLTIVDPNEVTTTLTYDARQRLIKKIVDSTSANPAETDFKYDSVGNLTQVTLPTKSYLKYNYDAAHRLTGISDSFCSSVCDSITYDLDNLGNRISEQINDDSGLLQKALHRTYNDLNQLLTVMGGASQITAYSPDLMGNVTSIKDPVGNVTGQSFDALNRLMGVVDPLEESTTYNYDSLDRVVDVTAPLPKGLNTQYDYDAFGDVTTQTSPDTGITQYTYDLDGNRRTKTDARNVTATYSYDVLNRLTGIDYPDPSRNVTYTYDQLTSSNGIGHLTSIQDASGTTVYQYDTRGNVLQKSVTMGGHVFTVSYVYDTADNLIQMTYPDGMQVNYGRDGADRINSVTANGTESGNSWSANVVTGVTYEPFGPVTGFNYGNNLVEVRSYDQDYRLTGIAVSGGVMAWTLTDDADDNITKIADGINGANTQNLGYDSLNRLTSASSAYGALGYSYDSDGNRTQQTLDGTPTTLTYDTASNKLLTVGGLSDGYDAVGNLTNDGSLSYNYDAADRLTGYTGTQTAYLYNGLGQRSIKFPVDNTAPTVSITAPVSGPVAGTVNVTATVVDDFGASVQLYLDGTAIPGDLKTATPYTFSWDTTTVSTGAHSLTAIATDPANNSSTSAPVSVMVDNIPPTVSISAPANGADVSGTVNVIASASDNVAVASVQFYLDGNPLSDGFVTQAPYTASWDTTTAAGGTHTLTAVAKDTAGNSATSTAVSVTVDDTAPGVTTLARAAVTCLAPSTYPQLQPPATASLSTACSSIWMATPC